VAQLFDALDYIQNAVTCSHIQPTTPLSVPPTSSPSQIPDQTVSPKSLGCIPKSTRVELGQNPQLGVGEIRFSCAITTEGDHKQLFILSNTESVGVDENERLFVA
jgi:hypothetical protein